MTYKQIYNGKCDPKKLALIIHFIRAQNENVSAWEPEPPGADPIWLERKSAPGPRTSGAGAAQTE